MSRYAILDAEARAVEAEISRFLLRAPRLMPEATAREVLQASRPRARQRRIV